jgi:hypothetical protein
VSLAEEMSMEEPLSFKTVNELAGLITQMPLNQIEELAQRLKQEQPSIFEFLVRLKRPPLDEEEHSYIVTLTMMLWAVMEQAGRPAAQVTMEMLQRASTAVDAEIASLSAGGPQDREARTLLHVTSYPEPGLLAYLLIALKQKADPPLEPDAQVVAFRSLRTLLDAMVRSRRPPRRSRRLRRGRQSTGRA